MGWAAAHSPETVAAMSVGGQSRHFDRGPAPSGLPRSTDIARPARLVVPRTDSATVLNPLLTGSCLAGDQFSLSVSGFPALIGLISLAVLAEVKKGDT